MAAIMAFIITGIVPMQAIAPSVFINEGTEAEIRLVDSATSNGSSEINGVIHNDIYSPDGEYIVIRHGTPVSIHATIRPNKSLGRPGSIEFQSATTTAVDGTPVMLSMDAYAKGNGKQGLAWGLGIATGIFTGFGFLCLLIEGRDAQIPQGTVIPATVAAYYSVDIPTVEHSVAQTD